MPFLKNVSPWGELEIPVAGGVIVASGEVFEVSDEIAADLLSHGDPANFAEVKAPKAPATKDEE